MHTPICCPLCDVHTTNAEPHSPMATHSPTSRTTHIHITQIEARVACRSRSVEPLVLPLDVIIRGSSNTIGQEAHHKASHPSIKPCRC